MERYNFKVIESKWQEYYVTAPATGFVPQQDKCPGFW